MDDSRGARQNPATDITEDEIGKLSGQRQWISLESE